MVERMMKNNARGGGESENLVCQHLMMVTCHSFFFLFRLFWQQVMENFKNWRLVISGWNKSENSLKDVLRLTFVLWPRAEEVLLCRVLEIYAEYNPVWEIENCYIFVCRIDSELWKLCFHQEIFLNKISAFSLMIGPDVGGRVLYE